MPTVIVPVGFIMGPEFGAGGPVDRDPLYWEVHLGGDSQQLTVEEFSAWSEAFTDPPKHAELTVNRQSLEQRLTENDGGLAGAIDNPDPIVTSLIERGLLVEFDPVNDWLQHLFDRLRLFPQGQGIGSTPDAPDVYRISFADVVLVNVSANVYRLWSYAVRFPTLWQACSGLAGSTGAPEPLAREVAAVVPLLVSAGAAFLDPLSDHVSG
ncbi:MAG: hypothetical protein ACRDMV_03735 [Streptosporangiales bacterium]